jgi:hypothetical protein
VTGREVVVEIGDRQKEPGRRDPKKKQGWEKVETHAERAIHGENQ